MKFLHIFRTAPDDLVRLFVRTLDQAGNREVDLNKGQIDYDQLVNDIFAAEKVICWW